MISLDFRAGPEEEPARDRESHPATRLPGQ